MISLFTGVIVFGSDQEVGELMQAVKRNNASHWFSWIGSDGWGGRSLAVDGNELEVLDSIYFYGLFIIIYSERENEKIRC